jgi:hypothetical protein
MFILDAGVVVAVYRVVDLPVQGCVSFESPLCGP